MADRPQNRKKNGKRRVSSTKKLPMPFCHAIIIPIRYKMLFLRFAITGQSFCPDIIFPLTPGKWIAW